MLDVIRSTEGGNQEITTPHQVASRKSVRRQQQHLHLTASDPNQKTRGAPSSFKGSTYTGFGYSSWDTSEIPSDNPTKYPSTVTIINPTSVPNETTTKYPSHVQKEFPSSKPINMLIEYINGDPIDAPITMPTDTPGSKNKYRPSSYPDALK